jgi:hypothetical protein
MLKAHYKCQRRDIIYTIYEHISDLDIGIGESKRMNCPNCNGYKTFTVTNNMGKLLWNCYKSSCKISGSKKVRLSVDDIRNKHNSDLPIEDFELPPYIVSHGGRRHIIKWCAEWGIDEEELGLLHDVKEDRVVFPVYSDGKIVDATGRALGKRLPKWKRYGNFPLPYTFGSGDVAVVVEDCVSAAVVGSDVCVGVAVLGTSLAPYHVEYLTQFSTVIIALDPDALPKTLAFAKELRGHVQNVKVLKLTDDLKYRNETDLEKLKEQI